MSRQLLPIAGRFEGEFVLSDGRRTTTREGYSSSANVKKDIKSMIRKAELDVLAQRMHFDGINIDGTDRIRQEMTAYEVVLSDFNIDYSLSRRLVRVKRVRIKGKYYTQVRNKRTGRFISTSRWSSKGYEIHE